MTKADFYKTAKIKDDAPIKHAGEFVGIEGHINETLFYVRFIDGEKLTSINAI